MRHVFAAVLTAALLLSAAASGAEHEKILIAEGAYSVDTPAGWTSAADAKFGTVTLSAGDSSALVLASPNPSLHAGQLVALQLAALSREGVDAEIIGGTMDKKNGLPRLAVQFVAPHDDKEALVGVMHVVTVDGFAVAMTATAPDSMFDAFAPLAEAAMDSIEISPAAMAENREIYTGIARQFREGMVEKLLAAAGNSPDQRQKIIDSIDALKPFETR
jgi:hypothetical protein